MQRKTLCEDRHCAKIDTVQRKTLCKDRHCAKIDTVQRKTLCKDIHCAKIDTVQRKTLCKVKISIEISILCDVRHIVRDVVTSRSEEHCICKYGEEVLKMETAEYYETLTVKC